MNIVRVSLWSFAVLTCATVKLLCEADECFPPSIDNYRLNTHVIKSFHIDHIHFCFGRCKTEEACYSINFNKDNLICELTNSTKTTNPRDFVKDRRFTYFQNPYRHHPCTSHICYNGGTCNADGSSLICACPDNFDGARCEFIANVSALTFTVNKCHAHTVMSAKSVELDATNSDFGRDLFCRMIFNIPAGNSRSTDRYILSMDIRSRHANGANSYVYPGFAYNVKDKDNFDLLYFRFHDAARCVQPCYVKAGVFYRDSQHSDCLLGVPTVNTWFTVTLEVTQSSVTVTVNGLFAKRSVPYFPPRPIWGPAIANGYSTISQFKNFKLE